jgi:hypothetical protein
VNVIAQSAYNAANNILASEYGNSNVALFLTSYTGNISSNVQTSNVIVTGSLSSNTIISNTHTSNTITSNTITFSDQSKQTTAWLGATPLLSNTSTYGTYKLLVDQNGVVNVPTSRFSTGQVFTPISTDLLVGTSSQYWQFKGDGSGIVFPNSTKQTTAFQLASSVPSTSHGQSGDTANTWAANATYLYFCSQNYTNGANSIWQRVAWSANTW